MNYSETVIVGQTTSWTRCNGIVCENPYNGVPAIRFKEEKKTMIPTGDIFSEIIGSVGVNELIATMENPTEEIVLVHPTTGAVVGTCTYQDVFVTLFSLYLQLAKKRDDEVARQKSEALGA